LLPRPPPQSAHVAPETPAVSDLSVTRRRDANPIPMTYRRRRAPWPC